jgi:hypothetical protein
MTLVRSPTIISAAVARTIARTRNPGDQTCVALAEALTAAYIASPRSRSPGKFRPTASHTNPNPRDVTDGSRSRYCLADSGRDRSVRQTHVLVPRSAGRVDGVTAVSGPAPENPRRDDGGQGASDAGAVRGAAAAEAPRLDVPPARRVPGRSPRRRTATARAAAAAASVPTPPEPPRDRGGTGVRRIDATLTRC